MTWKFVRYFPSQTLLDSTMYFMGTERQFWGQGDNCSTKIKIVFIICIRRSPKCFTYIIWEAGDPAKLGVLSNITWRVDARAGISTRTVCAVNCSLGVTFTARIRDQKKRKLFFF